YALLVRAKESGFHVLHTLAVAEHHGAETALNALPALIAIHRVVAPGDGGDFADADFAQLLLYLAEVAETALGRRVAAVHDAVDENFLHAFALRHFEHGVHVSELGVHAAIAAQSHDVEAVAFAGVLHQIEQQRVAEDRAGSNHGVDTGDVHLHHAAGPDIEVADFAVPHLSFRQTDRQPRRVHERVREIAQQHVIGGLPRLCDRVAFRSGREAPAVEDGQDERFGAGHKLGSFLRAAVRGWPAPLKD